MSDTQVTIGFGGSTGDFEAACQRAQQALSGVSTQTSTLTAGLTAATAGLNQAAPAMAAVTQSAAAASAAMTQLSPATRAASTSILDLINATTGVSRETRSAADAADVFRQALGDQTNEVKALRAANEDAAHAAGGLGAASHGVTRELIVLGHEMMMGNTSRFAGSLLVMGELLSNVSAYAGIAAAGVFGLGLAVYHVYENMKLAEEAAKSLDAQMALMGRDPAAVTEKVDELSKELRQLGGTSSSVGREIAGAFQGIAGTSDEIRDQLALLVPALHEAFPKKPIEEFAAELAKEASTLQGIDRFMTEHGMLITTAQKEAMAAFKDSNDLAGAQALFIERANAQWAAQFAAIQKAKAALQAYRTIQMGDLDQGIEPQGDAPVVPKVGLTGDKERSPQDQRLDEIEVRALEPKRKRLELDEQIRALELRLSNETAQADRDRTEAAVRSLIAERDKQRAAGDTSWLQSQREALAEQNVAIVASAKTSKEATADRLASDVAYWRRLVTDTRLSVTQRDAVQKELTRAEAAENMERLRLKEAADRAGAMSAKKSTQEQIAELSAEQAANKDDFVKWMAIEDQKLGILRTAYGVMSTQFQNELRAEETYKREHEARLLTIELARIDAENQLGQKKLAGTIQSLSAEAAAVLITKSDELAASRDATIAEGNLELKRLDDFIATLQKGTAEFDKAMKQRENLYQTFANRVAAIDTRIATEEKQAADRSTQAFTSAFDRIGSTGERMVSGMISGSTTWRQAEQQAASAVLQSVVTLAGQALARWTAYEIGKTAWTKGQDAIRRAQDEGSTGLDVIARALASWVGLETSKTAVTGAQTALRKTDETGADAATAVAAAATALAEIKASAAAAGAAAYASTAAIPIVGPELAPAAAATAYAGAMGFSAGIAVPGFATGAWNLPSDMIAQVHAGEMIVPAFQAEALRNGASLGGGGGPVININASAMDGPGMMSALRSVLPQLAKAMQSHLALNPSARPA